MINLFFFSLLILVSPQFRLNYSIVEPPLPRVALGAQLNPILDQMQADRLFQATFQKDCGSDDLCQSQLEVYPALQLQKDGMYSTILV